MKAVKQRHPRSPLAGEDPTLVMVVTGTTGTRGKIEDQDSLVSKEGFLSGRAQGPRGVRSAMSERPERLMFLLFFFFPQG